MILFLDNVTGMIDAPSDAQVRRYGEEVLCSGWNPALNELRLCLLTVAESEEQNAQRKKD